jgi:hypothetical protein
MFSISSSSCHPKMMACCVLAENLPHFIFMECAHHPLTSNTLLIDTLLGLILGVSFTTSRISSSTSGVPMQNSNVHKGGNGYLNIFLFVHLHPGYLSWYKRRTTTALPSAKLYMKCMLASSWFEYIISKTFSQYTLTHNYGTLLLPIN